MRTSVVAFCALAMVAAGCVSLPAAENDPFYSSGTEVSSREVAGDERMSAREVVRESNQTCRGSSRDVCVERSIEVAGKLSLDSLEVMLDTFNGPITLTQSDAGQWRMVVVLHAKGDTVEEARRHLDAIRFSWSHMSGGEHFVHAEASMGGGTRNGEGASMALALPRSTLVEAMLSTTNGPVTVRDVRTSHLAAQATNGPITIDAEVVHVAAKTTNGPIVAALVPTGSGSIALGATNGPVTLEVPEDERRGYDLGADTTNGFVNIGLRDGDTRGEKPNEKTFRTTGFDAREVQSRVRIETSNGPVSVSPA